MTYRSTKRYFLTNSHTYICGKIVADDDVDDDEKEHTMTTLKTFVVGDDADENEEMNKLASKQTSKPIEREREKKRNKKWQTFL